MAGVNSDQVQIAEDKFINKSVLLSHLSTYNLYYEGHSLQLRHREEEGELIIEGLLNIFWGLRRPIRLQMQDDKEPIRPTPLLRRRGPEGRGTTRAEAQTELAPPTIEVTAPTDQSEHSSVDTDEVDESAHLQRTRSDVGGRSPGGRAVPSNLRRIRRHRCSFNGHFYNHKTAVFTPAFGSVTNVRINSTMTTAQVLRVVLNKFRIENSTEEFSLFLLHTSGERVQLRRDDHPLCVRVLHGPCEQISKIFLMDVDQVEDVSHEVAQYIKLEMPVLQSFIDKLKEEELRETQKLKQRYSQLRCMIEKHMQSLAD
ncbi:ras association domain-containing protein 2b [Hoplias malabaricus]|uniref:ras association domain-containing protein 2b n=1 Tax=Hoplias malabaricus TaxID=27720 RepID=UPI003462A7DC